MMTIVRFCTLLSLLVLLPLLGSAEQMRPWIWGTSSCDSCGLKIVATNPQLLTSQVQTFIRTLENKKSELQTIYGVSGSEYNLLAQMAIGILGRESQFFKSRRYVLKEQFPWAVEIAKGLAGDTTRNSRGPTQIKIVPARIAEIYEITPDQLWVPENAALATMGFLIETLGELKRRIIVNKLSFVNEANYVDYLPYIYFGSTTRLISGKADPSHNIYIRDMKKYMSWVEVFEVL